VVPQIWYQLTGGMDGRIFEKEDAGFYFGQRLVQARREFPDNPELWPELVSAQITWEVTE